MWEKNKEQKKKKKTRKTTIRYESSFSPFRANDKYFWNIVCTLLYIFHWMKSVFTVQCLCDISSTIIVFHFTIWMPSHQKHNKHSFWRSLTLFDEAFFAISITERKKKFIPSGSLGILFDAQNITLPSALFVIQIWIM